MMGDLTPLVQPVSIDEAFLDLAGTQGVHGTIPAVTLARFAARVEATFGITVSVGLSDCKFLAKLASDCDKPRGYTLIGRAEARDFLRPRPVGAIWGVGAVTQGRLASLGFTTIGDIQDCTQAEFARRIGSGGIWPVAPGPRDRRAAGDDDARGQEYLGGDDVLTRPRDRRRPRANPLSSLREGRAAACPGRRRGGRCRSQAEDADVSPEDPLAVADAAYQASLPPFRGRSQPIAAGAGRHPLSADRSRRRPICVPAATPTAPTCSTRRCRARRRRRRRSTLSAPSSATRPWCAASRWDEHRSGRLASACRP